LAAEEAQPPAAAMEELRVVVEKLTGDNQRLKTELEQRETIIRLLTENLAIARTESELFQKKWSDAQLRAQTLGVDFADETTTQAQRQLVESVRALYLAEAERQRLIEQLSDCWTQSRSRGMWPANSRGQRRCWRRVNNHRLLRRGKPPRGRWKQRRCWT